MVTDFRFKLIVTVFLWRNSCHVWYISWPVARYMLRFAGATRGNLNDIPNDAPEEVVTFSIRRDVVRHDCQYNLEGLVWTVVAHT